MSKTTNSRDKYNKLPKVRRDKIDRNVYERLKKIRSIDMALEEYFDEDEKEVGERDES